MTRTGESRPAPAGIPIGVMEANGVEGDVVRAVDLDLAVYTRLLDAVDHAGDNDAS